MKKGDTLKKEIEMLETKAQRCKDREKRHELYLEIEQLNKLYEIYAG